MLVRFRTNLGSADAKAYGVQDFARCVYEAEVDLPKDAAQKLVERGIAVAVEPPEPVKVKGESKKPAITAPVK